ncbi:MAG: hypothetical protein GY861_09960 [bacterium]|nr:hypothetical protein [bacterium]
MQITHDKKGETGSQVVIWVVRMIFVIAVMGTAVIFIYAMVYKNVDIQEAESHVFANRMLYSKNGISGVENGRVQVGDVKTTLLITGVEDTIVFSKESYLAARISYNVSEDEEKHFYFHEDWYENYFHFVDMKGRGATTKSVVKRIVSLDGETRELRFEVLMPNEE